MARLRGGRRLPDVVHGPALSHRKPSSVAKTHRHRPPARRGVLGPERQVVSGSLNKTSWSCGSDQSDVVGEDHCLNTVPGADLGEDVADVGLHGGFGQRQPFADLEVAPAGGESGQHFALALGEDARSRWVRDSRSRWVRKASRCFWPGAWPGRRSERTSMSSRVRPGAMTTSPAATDRIPATSSSGRASFSRNPLAPARRASAVTSTASRAGATMTCAAVCGGGVLDDVGQDFLDDAVDGELEPWVRPAASPSVCGVAVGTAARARRDRATRPTRLDWGVYGCRPASRRHRG